MKRTPWRTCGLVAAVSLLGLTGGRAANFYVAVDGSDENPGTLERPFQTIEYAQRIVVPGDTVFVRAGTYLPMIFESNSLWSGTSTEPITYRAYPGEKPVIQGETGEGYAIFLGKTDHIIIDGFTTLNGEGGIHIDGRRGRGTYNQILNCDVSGAQIIGISIGNGASNNLIKGCRVYNNSRQNWPRDLHGGWGGGISVYNDSPSNTVEDCFVYFNHGEGLVINDGSHGAIVRHNVVADNWSANIYIQAVNNVLVEGNLVYLTEEAKSLTSDENSHPPGITLAIENNVWNDPELSGHTIINNVVVNVSDAIRSYGPWGIGDPDWHRTYSNWVIARNTLVHFHRGIFLECVDGIEWMTVRNNLLIGREDGQMMLWFPIVAGPIHLKNNLYCANDRTYKWFASEVQDLASWSVLSGERNSMEFDYSMAPNLLNDFQSIPPRLWSAPGLPAPVDINKVTLRSLADPYRLSTSSPAINAGATLSN